jgi:hypothetical protein
MVETLVIDSVFRMGYNAYYRGETRNPWKTKGSPAWMNWQAGYDAAEWNERYD